MSQIEANFVKRDAWTWLFAALLIAAGCWPAAQAQDGVPAGRAQDLTMLVGPIALYPDDLVAVILPASTYPVQIVEAARFLDQHRKNRSLEPDPSWDDTVVALLNYPEVLRMMSANLNWTSSLGQAVLDSQGDVMDAIQAFRDRAYAAGNLRSDEHQTVSRDADGTIEIKPADPEVVYIPYYAPGRAVVYETVPVLHYYSHPFPLYYYPYPAGYAFSVNFFWGVTSAFSISWHSHALDYYPPSYRGHPYFGRRYYAPYYIRRDRDDFRVDALKHVWRPGRHRTARPEQRANAQRQYVARRTEGLRRGVDRNSFVFAGRRDRAAPAAQRRQTAAGRSTNGERSNSAFRSYRGLSSGAAPRRQIQTAQRRQARTLAAQPGRNTGARFARGSVRREQPPHRPVARSAVRRATPPARTHADTSHHAARGAARRAAQAHDRRRGGRQTQRR